MAREDRADKGASHRVGHGARREIISKTHENDEQAHFRVQS